MNEIIPPYGFLNDVLPGDPWQPEPAARYNAVNELLKKEFSSETVSSFPRQGSSGFLTVKNTSDKEILLGSAVKIDTECAVFGFSRIDCNDPFVCGAPMTDGKGFWGLAVEKIRPGHAGIVQVSGVAVIRDLKGPRTFYETPFDSERVKKNEYVFPGQDGLFHLGSHGTARLLFYDKDSCNAVVLLGSSSYSYSGMFAVSDNGNGTLTVKGGATDLDSFYSSTAHFEDTVLPVVSESSEWHYVCLIAGWKEGRWSLSADIHRYPDSYFYAPGEKIFVPLARYAGIREDGYISGLVQLHQGGAVFFRERYYIEG